MHPGGDLSGFAAVLLAGGRAARLDGCDKASVEIDGRTLLTHALDAVIDASEVVVVGEAVPTDRAVTFVLEDPRFGGPVAALLTGVDAMLRRTPTVAVLAVDMPRVTAHTLRRLHESVAGHDGSVLVDPTDVGSSPSCSTRSGSRRSGPTTRVSTTCRCTACSTPSTWSRLRRWARSIATSTRGATFGTSPTAERFGTGVARVRAARQSGPVNLHDWIDELCDVLDLETEVDEGLLNDLAELAHENVDLGAGPVTTYLLGFAAGANRAGPATVELLAGKAQELAESWDRPAQAPDPVELEVEVDIPDDRAVDHVGEAFLDEGDEDGEDIAEETRP